MSELETEPFDLQAYLTKGVERVISDALRAALQNPRESAFLLQFAAASKAASRRRRKAEDSGEHIPTFLIASITSQCNLHCEGCYSRCNHATVDAKPEKQLSAGEWERLFAEADALGISFVLLAGGEPLLRRNVIEAAGRKQNMLFPIFTNGTFLDEDYLALFDKCRNLLPIMSIEGGKSLTDMRRGAGIYETLMANMEQFRERGLIFGVSVTVTSQNYREVISESFLQELAGRGCKAVIYVEYVPVSSGTESLAPDDAARQFLQSEVLRLRKERPEMVYVSFPGDEKSSGGCVAAGRGFFHINSHGGAEPCPFSPFSDVNVKTASLREALRSPLFTALRSGGILLEDHIGGCVLHEKRDQVEQLLSREKQKHS